MKSDNIKNRNKKKIIINLIKKVSGCSKCDERNTRALDFHHRDPKTKKDKVSKMLNHNYSLKVILQEIAKCDLLCANCHRKEHKKVESN